MTREELLAAGPERSARRSSRTASPSFGIIAGYFDRALAGEAPVLRMAASRRARQRHSLRSAHGAAAVVRPPADSRQHHRHHRAQAQPNCSRSASGACSSAWPATSISTMTLRSDHRDVVERVTPDASARSRCSTTRQRVCVYVAGQRLPREFAERDRRASPIGRAQRLVRARRSTCSGRSSSRDIARDALWENLRERRARRRPARLLVDADPRVRRPHPRHAGVVFPHAAQPAASRFRADGAPDAARRHRHRTQARGGRAARQRGALSRPVRQRHRRRLQRDGRRPVRVGQSGARADARLRARARSCSPLPHGDVLSSTPHERARDHRELERDGGVRNAEYQLRARDGTHHHGGRERAARPRRAAASSSATKARSPTSRERKRAEVAAVRGEGEGAGHAAVDRRRRHHDRCATAASST